MIYQLEGITYDFSKYYLKVNDRLARSNFSLYTTYMKVLKDFGYKFDPLTHPLPPYLLHWQDMPYVDLRNFLRNTISVLCVAGPEDVELFNACRLGYSGLFDAFPKREFIIVCVDEYDSHHHLLRSFASRSNAVDFAPSGIGHYFIVRI